MIGRSAIRAQLVQISARHRSSFYALSAILFLVYFSSGIQSTMMPVYAQSLGADTREIGLVLATFQLAALLSQLWWGNISDRLGRRKPLLLIGTLGMSCTLSGAALAREWGVLVPLLILQGMAMAAYSTGSLALIGDLLEDQGSRGKLMGMYRTWGSLAFAIAAFSGGWLADSYSMRVPLLLAASGLLIGFLISTRIREQPLQRGAGQAPPVAAPEASEHGERLTTRRAIWSFLALVFLWTFAMGAIAFLWPVYMRGVGYSQTMVGSLWALAALGEVPCLILAGILADRWGRKRVLLIGMSCMALVYLCYTVSTALWWLIPVQLVRAFAYASYEAPSLLYATELGLRRQRGRLASYFYAANGGGGVLGSAIGGSVAQAAGASPVQGLVVMYRGVAIFMLLGIALAGRFLPRISQVRSQAENVGNDD